VWEWVVLGDRLCAERVDSNTVERAVTFRDYYSLDSGQTGVAILLALQLLIVSIIAKGLVSRDFWLLVFCCFAFGSGHPLVKQIIMVYSL